MKRMLLALLLGASLVALWAAGMGSAATTPPPIQAAGQSASNDQTAVGASSATQVQPSNDNTSVRVLSPGNDGSVNQTNSAQSTASATNANTATQNSTQALSGVGCGCASAPIQAATQAADSGQAAGALSAAGQLAASNGSAPTAVVGGGSGGSTNQSNTDTSGANAANTNGSGQTATQSSPGGSGLQAAQQSADNSQGALATSNATQIQPSNSNVSVRVLSPGNDGNVSQTNSASSNASATNSNGSTQNSGQTAAGGGSGIQAADQSASNDQTAVSGSLAQQVQPQNNNVSVRVLSPGSNGSVSQTNSVDSHATSTNANTAHQTSTQTAAGGPSCGCGSSSPIQAAIQNADNTQQAGAFSASLQSGASNTNAPIRVLSPGSDGSVTQSNNDTSSATANNTNTSNQTANQTGLFAGTCGCQSQPIQVVGQSASNDQTAIGLSAAIQFGASNTNDPIRVLSPGSGGSVHQSNTVNSSADATNSNSATQHATETAFGSGSPIQAIGQRADNTQGSLAASVAAQIFPERSPCGCGSSSGNVNSPFRVLSPGSDGSVSQTNDVTSTGHASNTNATDQTATQFASPSIGCGCSRSPIQALGQLGENTQQAFGLSAAFQFGASNANHPRLVLSPGAFGSLTQRNGATSSGTGSNNNRLTQSGHQAI
ncbi:MAG: hypothetical protein E6G13_01065 [Actinobacteria bacterium]|nr:MAG: hypothetical protein E6G13_01065 [Actinomycetota bacterium]